MKLIFLAFGLMCFQTDSFSQKFDIALIPPASNTSITLQATITNKWKKPMSIPENRSVNYEGEHVINLGTYIIELQNYQDSSWRTLYPTAYIGPIGASDKFIKLETGQSISDTIEIPHRIFRTSTNKNAFSPGKYRVRVALNSNGTYDKKGMFTKWVEFKIES